MRRTTWHGGALALLLATLSPGLAGGQPVAPDVSAPARNGNVWNGRDHEPAAGSVRSKERAVGIAPSQQQQVQENRDLDAIGHHLTAKARNDVANAPPPPRPPNPDGP